MIEIIILLFVISLIFLIYSTNKTDKKTVYFASGGEMKLNHNGHYEHCECTTCKPDGEIARKEKLIAQKKVLDKKALKWLKEFYDDPVPIFKKYGFDKFFYEDKEYWFGGDFPDTVDFDELKDEHYISNEWDLMTFDLGIEGSYSRDLPETDDYYQEMQERGVEDPLYIDEEDVKDETVRKYLKAIGEFGTPDWVPREIITKLEDREEREYQKLKSEQLEIAKEHEELLEFEKAAKIYKNYGMKEDVIRTRKLKNKDRKVIHGDTIIKDSVVSKSNVGSSNDDKVSKIKELKELLDSGAIDDDEFKQMKKEILGK
jgi:hypothetical protein